ncbi:hypothetical protein QTQ03_28290 [Micromonospora sp. WMMA1363]|uniref:hypothetical protein n=1 Tax=Micromonospora sp. WMMA1363 TaxID=3053985 RepID=UPI00259D04F0|nr:hypothetical protein [Micromonospora sp. WMMA1363]MDM4723307.1 hypothetical protein [Micromonospora sp. WMMA1363]
MGKTALRRRCERILSGLDLPEPFDIDELCQRLGEQRGRPIHLVPIELPPGGACGMWASTAHFDAIFYQANTSPLHQAHIQAHEIGHMICDHSAIPVDGAGAALLLPGLDPALVRHMMERTDYTGREEREAEVLASLLLERTSSWTPRRANRPPDVKSITHRLMRSLGHGGQANQ